MPANAQLAQRADGRIVAIVVEHPCRARCIRHADRHDRMRDIVGGRRAKHAGDGGLRRAIEISETDMPERPVAPLRERVARQTFAADGDLPQRRQRPGRRRRAQPLLPIGGRQARERDARVDQMAAGRVDVPRLLAAHLDLAALQQRGQQFVQRHVEIDGGGLQHGIVRADPVRRHEVIEMRGERAVADRHALGPPGRARRVDDIGELFGMRRVRGRGRVRRLRAGRAYVERRAAFEQRAA